VKTWKTLFASLGLALALGVVGPPAAHAQMEGEAELAALVAKNATYQAMAVEAEEIFIDTVGHMDAAFEKGQAPLSKADAQAWSAAWETKARARLAALKQRLATTPRITVEEAKKVFGPGDSGLSELMADAPNQVQTTLEGAERTLDQTAALAPLVAAGDAAATDKLAKAQFAASLYMIEVENQLLRTAVATAPPGHPQRSLAQAMLASNLVTMEIQRANLRNYNGEPIAGQAAAQRARVHLAEGMTAAKRIPGEAKATVEVISSALPPEAKGLVRKTRAAFATFAESAKVELEMMKILDAALSALAREDMDKMFADGEKSARLVDRRVALQAERTSLLSQ
jgi:hypothetical protein